MFWSYLRRWGARIAHSKDANATRNAGDSSNYKLQRHLRAFTMQDARDKGEGGSLARGDIFYNRFVVGFLCRCVLCSINSGRRKRQRTALDFQYFNLDDRGKCYI